ncbi:type B 50S ribosomal protein L31 [Zobellella iuensis]|uniref:Large ribosomal subunit protein bL31B n=1 Tax=Zobellella iuensis TaxID=2803811 RepID=A0ABS1QWC4_9GAMM|nr:type B 50S ribosomal protein L31 [Zobellella iuensis]MBL1379165.1 type B 50S ribosomal protein L31 [Zobellella iuensis]
MKTGIHPEYRQVVFHDASADTYFKVGSTMNSQESILWSDGKHYPLVRLDVSSASHPFYTGQQRTVAAEGRVRQFQRRFKGMASGGIK